MEILETPKQVRKVINLPRLVNPSTNPEEEIEDLGITLLNLTVLAIKRDIRIRKENDLAKGA